jgi:glycosyltransferase involved in cell wall biosynthesis
VLEEKELNAVFIKFSLIEKVRNRLMLTFAFRWLFSEKKLFSLEYYLLKLKTDLVYFVGPSLLSQQLKQLNYIFTLFDLAHRDHPEFPEVREYDEFQKREQLYSQVISQSFITLTDSEKLSENVSKFYGIDPSRLINMPYSPSPDLDFQSRSVSEVREHYQLPSSYFFYPAQFWPHKNHIRILEALAILKKTGNIFHVVFSGGDKGNIDYILKMADQLILSNQIHILGLVPSADMKALYKGSDGVIMPTYFGPTNLPPLEAWDLGVPLIYSKYLEGQSGDAALLVDPDSAESLAHSLIEIVQSEVKDRLVRNGRIQLKKINEERSKSELKLRERLAIFGQRRKCWA